MGILNLLIVSNFLFGSSYQNSLSEDFHSFITQNVRSKNVDVNRLRTSLKKFSIKKILLQWMRGGNLVIRFLDKNGKEVDNVSIFSTNIDEQKLILNSIESGYLGISFDKIDKEFMPYELLIFDKQKVTRRKALSIFTKFILIGGGIILFGDKLLMSRNGKEEPPVDLDDIVEVDAIDLVKSPEKYDSYRTKHPIKTSGYVRYTTERDESGRIIHKFHANSNYNGAFITLTHSDKEIWGPIKIERGIVFLYDNFDTGVKEYRVHVLKTT